MIPILGLIVLLVSAVGLASVALSFDDVRAGTNGTPRFTFAPEPTSDPGLGALTLPASPAVLIVGDSYELGHGIEFTGEESWGPRLVSIMGWSNVRFDSVGGTGMAQNVGGPAYTDRLRSVGTDFVPDLVLIQGSVNDIKSAPEDVVSKTKEAVAIVAERWPNAATVVVGPITADDYYQRLEDSYADGVGRNAYMIDAMTWLPKDRPDLRTVDLWHPSVEGHKVIATEMANAINALTIPSV